MPDILDPITKARLRTTAPSERNRPGYAHLSRLGEGASTFLYVAKCRGFIKLGLSIEPEKRVASMRSGCPFPIRLVHKIAIPLARAGTTEHNAMLLLNGAHHVGEWFRCSVGNAIYAADHAALAFTP